MLNAEDPVGQVPEGDDFYQPPASLPGTHGDVIWSRPLEGPAALKSAVHNELVLYHSEAVDGTPVGVSGIVALPPDPPLEQGYPVVSWAHGTLGLGAKCAPSRDSADMARSLPDHHLINQVPHGLLNAFLRQGWAVVMTDYEGLGTPGPHPYLLGESEAHGVLDMVRAARRLYPQISDRLATVGHSQGGQAALFAAHYAPAWTPELDLRGVAALAPASHLKEGLLRDRQVAKVSPGFAFTPLMLTGAVIGSRSGATAGGKVIDLAQVLTDEALELFGNSGCKCLIELSRPDSWGGIPGTAQFRGDLIHHPNDDQQELLRQLTLMNPALEIPAPVRIAHATGDSALSITDTNTLVSELGDLNNDVTYRIYPRVGDGAGLGPHFGVFDTDTPDMIAWLSQSFTS